MSFRRSAIPLAILSLVCAAHAAVAAGPSTDVQYGADQVTIETGAVYSRLSMEGARASKVPGAPALPVQYLRFVIPSDARVANLAVSFDELELPGSYRVAPAQPEAPMGETPLRVEEDASIYGSAEPYPAARAEYLGDGFLGGYRIATVAVHPLQYTPRSGALVLATNISIELELEADADRSHPRSRVTANSDDLYRGLVRDMVENPWEVDGKLSGVDVVDGVGEAGFLPRYTPSLEGSPVEYVIITNEELEPYFQPLADWKTKKGIPTVIRTVSWIEDNYEGGVDTTERIRFFIQDAYESWGTTYVLIGGDTNIVPIRYVWSSYLGGWDLTSDLYYSDLDGNWNWDGDSDFGEAYETALAPGDSVDFYPDVFVGRAPAATSVEAETFVTKILDYEKNSDPVFAARSLYMADVLFPTDWEPGELTITDGAEHIVEPVIPLIPPEVHYVRLYQNHIPFPGSLPNSAAAALDSLSSGYNIAAHVGHGNKDIMRFGAADYVSIQDIDALSNGTDRSGFLWMLNCTTTKIEEDCISEHFMNNPNGGASMLFGPTRFCFPTTAKDYFYEWHSLLYSGVERAGVVSAMSKVAFIPASSYDNTDRWTQMSFVFLGDPETRLWIGRPTALSAAHDDSISLGPVDLTVTVTDSAAVDSAYVCVAKDGEVYETAYTDVSGQAILSFTPQTEGTLTVTVSARNHYA
ncbi:MAG TPA: C25 family cysteine peptidase, partial [bacterium]|nr:C25 family cysteine peptidase [bacterium]